MMRMNPAALARIGLRQLKRAPQPAFTQLQLEVAL